MTQHKCEKREICQRPKGSFWQCRNRQVPDICKKGLKTSLSDSKKCKLNGISNQPANTERAHVSQSSVTSLQAQNLPTATDTDIFFNGSKGTTGTATAMNCSIPKSCSNPAENSGCQRSQMSLTLPLQYWICDQVKGALLPGFTKTDCTEMVPSPTYLPFPSINLQSINME